MDNYHHHHRDHSRHRHRDRRSYSPGLPSNRFETQDKVSTTSRYHGERERSPIHTHHHSRKRKHSSHTTSANAKEEEIVLPHNARKLVKGDLPAFRPLLGLYLDIQKRRDVEVMGEEEVRGRWRSFLGKWNRGELAKGYYDAETLRKAVVEGGGDIRQPPNEIRREDVSDYGRKREGGRDRDIDGDVEGSGSDSEEEIGPALPPSRESKGRRRGPAIPNIQDLEFKRETELEDRQAQLEDIRHARKADRLNQKSLLEEILPRPDAGRDRQLEKKKLLNEKLKGFREKSPDGGAGEVSEGELMGEDGVDGFKRRKKEVERKKTEREVRKEEFLRARAEEREERLRGYREKEEGTLEMLKALAKRQFG